MNKRSKIDKIKILKIEVISSKKLKVITQIYYNKKEKVGFLISIQSINLNSINSAINSKYEGKS